MAINHNPETNTWYINANNQFLRVWAVVYQRGQTDKIVLRYLNGSRAIIGLEEWYRLDLLRYPRQDTRQSAIV